MSTTSFVDWVQGPRVQVLTSSDARTEVYHLPLSESYRYWGYRLCSGSIVSQASCTIRLVESVSINAIDAIEAYDDEELLDDHLTENSLFFVIHLGSLGNSSDQEEKLIYCHDSLTTTHFPYSALVFYVRTNATKESKIDVQLEIGIKKLVQDIESPSVHDNEEPVATIQQMTEQERRDPQSALEIDRVILDPSDDSELTTLHVENSRQSQLTQVVLTQQEENSDPNSAVVISNNQIHNHVMYSRDRPNYKDQVHEVLDQISNNINTDINNRNDAGTNINDTLSPIGTPWIQTTTNRRPIGAIHVQSPFQTTGESAVGESDVGDDSFLRNLNYANIEDVSSLMESVDATEPPFIPNAYVVEQARTVVFAEAHPINTDMNDKTNNTDENELDNTAHLMQRNVLFKWVIKHPNLARWTVFLVAVLVVSLIVAIVTVVLISNSSDTINNTSTNILRSSTPSISPRILPLNQPSLASKTIGFESCFESRNDLRNAVITYMDSRNDKSENNNASTVNAQGYEIGSWCVSKVKDFSYLFYDLGYIFNEDISQWNTSSAVTMEGMFAGAASFNQDISQWDVSSVTRMRYMFWNASSFNQDISRWNVSSVTRMRVMFAGAITFNQDISRWDVSNVETMGRMFAGATSFNVDLSSWNISKVTQMDYMFYNATSYYWNLCKWGRSINPEANTSGMFEGATSCPSTTNPSLSLVAPGPFCFFCE